MHCCAYVITFTLDMVFLFFNGHGHGLVSNASSGPIAMDTKCHLYK